MDYRHTQRGHLPVFVAAFFVVILGIILPQSDSGLVALIVAAFCGLIFGVVWIFSQLTVAVASGEMRALFRFGWPQRKISLPDVQSARQVRNRWYYGWGVRWVPHGWMYNVWGLDAIELRMGSGRVFRIGTDEPEELLAALHAHGVAAPGGLS